MLASTWEADHTDDENEKVDDTTPLSMDAACVLGAVNTDNHGSGITISDDDDTLSFPNSDLDNSDLNVPSSHITTNPATLATTGISSSLVVEDGSDSDWGFEVIDDPDMIQAIGWVLDDPFNFGARDGRD